MRTFLELIAEALGQPLDEAVNAPDAEIFHWATTDNMLGILKSGELRDDTTQHTIAGKTTHGVSMTRDAFLDLSNTYAVAGRRPWRLGFNRRALQNRFKIVPIRDDYLRKVPRGKLKNVKSSLGLGGPTYTDRVSSDECEEFVLGTVPLQGFLSSIAVEDRWVDATSHPGEIASDPNYYEQEFELHSEDHDVLFGILLQAWPEFMEKMLKTGSQFAKAQKKFRWSPPHFVYPELPNGEPVPLLTLYRDSHAVRSFKDAYAWVMKNKDDD